jgi:hypothetical protein
MPFQRVDRSEEECIQPSVVVHSTFSELELPTFSYYQQILCGNTFWQDLCSLFVEPSVRLSPEIQLQ